MEQRVRCDEPEGQGGVAAGKKGRSGALERWNGEAAAVAGRDGMADGGRGRGGCGKGGGGRGGCFVARILGNRATDERGGRGDEWVEEWPGNQGPAGRRDEERSMKKEWGRAGSGGEH